MWRWVIKDYFTSFRWYKISALMKGYKWFWVIYLIVILPVTWGMFAEVKYSITYYLMMLPVGFSMVAAALQKIRLSKIFYICPMEKTMRRAYIERKFLLSVLVSAFMGGVSTVLLLVLRLCHPLTAGVYFFNMLVISVFEGDIFRIQAVEVPKESSIQAETAEMRGGAETAAYLLSFVGVFGMCAMLSFGPAVEAGCKWIFFGAAVVLLLPITVKGLTGWNGAVERSLSYEVIKTKPRRIGGAS